MSKRLNDTRLENILGGNLLVLVFRTSISLLNLVIMSNLDIHIVINKCPLFEYKKYDRIFSTYVALHLWRLIIYGYFFPQWISVLFRQCVSPVSSKVGRAIGIKSKDGVIDSSIIHHLPAYSWRSLYLH